MHLYMYMYIWKGVPRYIFPLFIELKTCAFPVRNMLITVKEPERIPGISWFIKNPITLYLYLPTSPIKRFELCSPT